MLNGIGPLEILILVLVFAATIMVFLSIAPLFTSRINLGARLSAAPSSAQAANVRLRSNDAMSPWAKIVQAIEARGISLNDTKSDAIREKLALANFHGPHAVRIFVLTRAVLTLALPALALVTIFATGSSMSATDTYLYLTLLAAIGLYLPNFVVNNKADARRKEILNGFPDTLDLLLVCVEAGLGIDACFNRVGSEITTSHPLLAELFAGVALELRAGRSREDALRNLVRRSGVPQIAAFVTLIIQSDKLGSSISQALKAYAAEMREGRRMRAEEKAHRLPVLLSVPLVAFMLPVMVGVLMLPAVLSMRASGGTM